jgi:PTS system mannose-specific IIA component
MIGLVIVTYGGLADALRQTLEHVVGPQRQIETIAICDDDDPDARRADVLAAARCTDDGDGVVIVTDVFGSTPSNLAVSAMEFGRVEVIAGINLPLLIKLAQVRDACSLEEAIAAAVHAGRKYVTVAGQVLAGERQGRTTRRGSVGVAAAA